MEFFETNIIPYFNYWVYVVLMMIGMHAMIVKNNLIKKLIGMSIFQTAIILFYVSIGVKKGAGIPIVDHYAPGPVNPDDYANPLPHVLMLTAIVVGVSTLSVALAVAQSVYRHFGTLEESEIVSQIKQGGPRIDV
jgi:multicomponent Na+:H+ antiporter subunit C